MDNPKYKIGQLIQPLDGHLASKIVQVIGSENGWVYSVAAKSFNPETEEVTEGVRHYDETELTDEIVETAVTQDEEVKDES